MKLIEQWRDVVGYEGLYAVSNNGRVKSVDNYHTFISKLGKPSKRFKRGKFLGRTFSHDYNRVTLCKLAVSKIMSVHRLVAIAFIPNPNEYPDVNHIDGNKRNNNVSNLEWCTKSQNTIHSYSVLKRTASPNSLNKGGEHPASVPILQFDLNGSFIKEWAAVIEIQRELGVNSTNVIACCRGKQKTCGGFIWKHKEYRKIRQKIIRYEKFHAAHNAGLSS